MTKRTKIIIIVSLIIAVPILYLVVSTFYQLTQVQTSNKYLKETVTKPRTGSGIPNDVIEDAHNTVSIRWSKGSVADGNDYCAIFDKVTHQIYFTKINWGGLRSNTSSSSSKDSTYYTNNKISLIEAYFVAKNNCYS